MLINLHSPCWRRTTWNIYTAWVVTLNGIEVVEKQLICTIHQCPMTFVTSMLVEMSTKQLQ